MFRPTVLLSASPLMQNRHTHSLQVTSTHAAEISVTKRTSMVAHGAFICSQVTSRTSQRDENAQTIPVTDVLDIAWSDRDRATYQVQREQSVSLPPSDSCGQSSALNNPRRSTYTTRSLQDTCFPPSARRAADGERRSERLVNHGCRMQEARKVAVQRCP